MKKRSKIVMILMILIMFSTTTYAFLSNPISILDVSNLRDTNVNIKIVNKETYFTWLEPKVTGFTLYLNTSMKHTVIWDINESDDDIYTFPVPFGEKIVMGGYIE